MDLAKLTNHTMRLAIWSNRVSFPAQVPVFPKLTRSDIQSRVVQLYFLRGWSFRDVGKRYGLTPQRIMQIVDRWRARAIATGYIQEIPVEEPALSLRPSPDWLPAYEIHPIVTRARESDSRPTAP